MNKLQTQNLNLSFISTMSLTESYRRLFREHSARLLITGGNMAKGDLIYRSTGLRHTVLQAYTSCWQLQL